MDGCSQVIEIKEEIIEDDIEIVDDVFHKNKQTSTVSQPKRSNIVNLPVKVSQPKHCNIVHLPIKVSQPKPSNPPSLPEIKCMVEGCPTKGRSAESNYFCLTEQRYDSWIKALGEDPALIKLDPAIPYKYLVCQRHFRQCDFRGRLQKINDNAVPSINLPRKPEIVKVVPHEVVIVEDIAELDQQSQELCFTVFQKLKNSDIPLGKSKLQQAALLCGISYHTMKKIIKSRKEVRTKTKSLIAAILQIEKSCGGIVPSVDFYYKQLRNHSNIKCSKKELLRWLRRTGVNFRDTKNAGRPALLNEEPIIIIDQSDEEVDSIDKASEIEKMIVDEESLQQETNVQPLFITVQEANLLTLLPTIYEPFRVQGKTPSIDHYYTTVLEMTKEYFSKDTLKNWLDQLNIKYKNNDQLKVDVQATNTGLNLPEEVIETQDEPETLENIEIEKLIGDDEALEQEKNVQPLFIKVTEANLLHLLSKIYEPFRIEDKIPSFDYYHTTVLELLKESISKDILKEWLDQLNIKYEYEPIQSEVTEMSLVIKSALKTIYNIFYNQNESTKLPTLEYMYDNLKNLVEEEFTKGTLIQWLHTLGIKFEINKDIISAPTLEYFDGQLTLRDYFYSKETISAWLKQLNIYFKEEQNSRDTQEKAEDLTDDLQHLLVQSNDEFHKASPTSPIPPTIAQILTDAEYSFYNLGVIATLDGYHGSLLVAGITCAKENLANWLNVLGIKYTTDISTNIIGCNKNLPFLDYFYTKLDEKFMNHYTKENIRYFLKQLKICFKEETTSEPNIEIPTTLLPTVASELKKINIEFYLLLIGKWLDFESIEILNRIVDESGSETPSLNYIHNQLVLKNKNVSKKNLKECLTTMNIRFTTKSYQYSTLIDDITAALKYNCRIPTLDYFYANITSATNAACSRKQLQKWLDIIGILYYPSSIEDGRYVPNETELTSQMISYLIKLDRDYSQSGACVINILKSIRDKFAEKCEIPTLTFIHHYLQSYRLFCNENPSYYSKDVLRHWLKVLRINFIEESVTIVDQSGTYIPTLTEFYDKFKELTDNVCEENQLALWLDKIGIKYNANKDLEEMFQEPQELTQEMIDILTKANREILLNNLKYQLKEIEWTLMLQNQNKKPSYYQLERVIDKYNVLDHSNVPLTKKQLYKDWLREVGIQFYCLEQIPTVVDDIIDAPKYNCRIPTLDYFYDNITSPTNEVCSRKQLQKWLDVIGILYYPSSIEDGQIVPNETPLTSQMISSLIKLDRDYPQSSSADVMNLLKSINDKFVEKGEIPTLNFMHHYLQSYKLFFNENPSYYSKDVLRHWLKVLKINFIEENVTTVDKSDTYIPTLTEFYDKFKELTDNVCEENQLALWLDKIGIKYNANKDLEETFQEPQELTQEIIETLTRANREILLNNLKYQLKEIEWTLMLQNQNKKPGYDQIERIIDKYNVFDHSNVPLKKKQLYKDWLQEIGIQFHDDEQIPTEITPQNNPMLINSSQNPISIISLNCPGAVLVKLTDLPIITVPNPTVTNFPELVISEVRSLNAVPTNEQTTQHHTESAVASTSKETETDASFRCKNSFVDESFFKNIELQFTAKGKVPSLQYIHGVLKEKGLVFEESTLKKLLNSMDINYTDENIIKKVDERSDEQAENTNMENDSVSDKIAINDEIKINSIKRKGQHEHVRRKQAKVRSENNKIVVGSNNVMDIEDNETEICKKARKRKSKTELVENLNHISVNTKKTEEHPAVKIVHITKLLDKPPETQLSDPKKITKPNQSFTKNTDINLSERVISIFTDVEHDFHHKGKIPTLDDFYIQILGECGNQYDKETIKKWLTKIGIKFKEK